jgi:helix-turn-helix protein
VGERPALAAVSETPSLGNLLNDPGLAWDLDEREARRLLPRVAALQAVLAVKLAAREPRVETPGPQPLPSRNGDHWLTVAQVAERLGRDRRWVYRRAYSWDFTVKDGKALLFSERGLAAWMDRHRVLDAESRGP